jgi:hypothetical protein
VDSNVLKAHFEQFGEIKEVILVRNYSDTLMLHKQEIAFIEEIKIC